MYCEACKFWVTTEPGGVKDRTGNCRRFPPVVVPSVQTEGPDERAGRYVSETYSTTASEWPETESRDWCGEFKAC